MPLLHAETSAPTATVPHQHAAPVPLWRSRAVRDWQAAAIWLAELHVAPVPVAGELRRRDRADFYGTLDRALATYGDAVAPMVPAFERAAARLAGRPAGLLHGSFYASNVLVDHPGDGLPRIRALQWETAGIGCGLLDLAALLCASWTREARTAITAAYARALPAGLRPPVRELVQGVEDALTVLSVEWLAWAPGPAQARPVIHFEPVRARPVPQPPQPARARLSLVA